MAAGIYLLYALIMIFAHPLFIYPFGADRFDAPAFEKVILSEPQTHLQFSSGDSDAPAVLYFMGNGGALAYFQPSLRVHTDAGRTVAAVEYPGGGGIPGTSSELLLRDQALAAFDWLDTQTDNPIYVHGYSLGTGLAQYVAAHRTVEGVILVAPYARMCDLMTAASWLPACYLPGVQKWDSLALSDQISAPVLILHGAKDQLIPIENGARLADRLQQEGVEVTFQTLANGNHHNMASQPEFSRLIADFIDPHD
ncbi:alpha/beta hydrolase family protein [Loktanella sp. S4079]|uniref:alpha/beta hydrolase family protein n=1 Tax=Loktanella sp. S4079 TaxID=579483 RepID=UPI000B0806D8|nr:prolyl oligopeptidase family serine peptidase [Loktanella sp. S4079]